MKISDYILSEEQYKNYISKLDNVKYKVRRIDENGNVNIDEKSYILTYEEYTKCLWDAILGMSVEIEDAIDSKNEKPKSFIVVAPPGAGKSALSSYEEAEHLSSLNRNLIRIDPDKVGLYHKYYKEIYDEIPEYAFCESQKFIRTALNDTIRPLVLDGRFDTLSEGTFGDTEGYKKIIRGQKEKGYEVIISTIVTPRIERDLSSCERFQALLDMDLPGRMVNFEYSKKVEEKYMETFKQIEQEGLYDEIKVYRRGKDKKSAPILVCSSGDNRYLSIIEAIQDELIKGERMIAINYQSFQDRIDNLRKIITEKQNNETTTIQLQQLDDIQQRFDEMIIKYNIKGKLEEK